jgi:E3 ubiquitin-protein ligase HUWE1
MDEQVVAIITLEALARSRTRLSEVLSAVNASASHGVLLYILRKMAANLCEDEGMLVLV